MKNSTKKFAKRAGVLALSSLMAGSALMLGACGGPGGSNGKLQFWVYGSPEELSTFTLMTNEFNNTYGKDHNIEVEISAKPVGTQYANLIQTTASASQGADIFFVIENDFKKWVEMGFMQEMTSYFEAVDDIDISDIPESMLLKYRYDAVNETKTTESDPLYGLPMEVRPTALFYNESVFEQAGIIVISVDEKDMDAWNAGSIADKRGKFKSDFPKLNGIDVPKKGYFRDDGTFEDYGIPGSDVVQVFNNRIAMNWDEVESLGKIFTPYNSEKKTCYNPTNYGTEYGYFTEWWFNYVWSVGGDCLADLNGKGYWNFSLLENYPNYKVETESYVGEYTGTVYKKGDTLLLNDKLNVPKGQKLTPDNRGGYKLGTAVAEVRPSVEAAAAEGDFTVLPSMRTAFQRYCRLGVPESLIIGDSREGDALAGGLGISPTPSIFSGSGRTAVNYFYSGKIAMLVEQSPYVSTIAKETSFKWDVAPIAVYKEYEDPSDPYNDTVVAQGKVAGHSNSRGLVTRKKSTKKDEIARFIMWMASKDGGQKVRAQLGEFPNQESLASEIVYKGDAPSNISVFFEAMKYQQAGDWWYLKNYTWIDVWAVPLNTKLRNVIKDYTYEKWVDESVKDSNDLLLSDYIRPEAK